MCIRFNSKKIITIIVLLFVPLSTYVTINENVTLGDVALVFAIFLAIFNKKNNTENNTIKLLMPLVLYMVFIIISTSVHYLIGITEIKSNIFSVLRYILYILSVSILSKNYFDKSLAYKYYKKFAFIFAIYCVIQFVVFHSTGISLPANVLGLKASTSVERLYTKEYIKNYLSQSILYRPYSVFIEPSYYSMYEIPIMYLILSNPSERKKYLKALFISLTFILNGSTTGMALAIVCWLPTFYRNIFKKVNLKFILFFVGAFIIIIGLSSTEIIQKAFLRIINSDGSFGSSILGRFNGITSSFQNEPVVNKIFGNGIGNNKVFLPSINLVKYFFGYIGVIVLTLLGVSTYKKLNENGKFIMIIFSISLIGTASLFNITSVLYLILIFSNYNDKENVYEQQNWTGNMV